MCKDVQVAASAAPEKEMQMDDSKIINNAKMPQKKKRYAAC